MKTLKATTQRGKSWLLSYSVSRITSIFEAYGKPSTRKVAAYYDCKKKMTSENGQDFRIISAGSDFFSVGWRTAAGLRVETAYNSYLIA